MSEPGVPSRIEPRTEGFDHMTVVVDDLDAAKRFFGLLGFAERIAVVATGPRVSEYMAIPGWEADHVTLVLEGAAAHQEIQLLRFHRPPADTDPGAGTLHRMGFNHVCFRVNDLDAMLAHLAEQGVSPATRSSTTTNASSSFSTARASWWSWPSGRATSRAGGTEGRRQGVPLGSMTRPEGWQSGRMHSS